MSKTGKTRILAAWGVHAFTALGAVIAILAFAALIDGDFRRTLLWLGAALIVDGLDGPMARKLRVSERTPSFDGAVLDHIIDYLNYTIIPALMVMHFDLVPPHLTIVAAAFMAATALYCFGNKNMKTPENDFRGFPAIWNLVVLAFYIASTGPWVNLAVIAILGLLTFAPVRCVHPLRVRQGRPLTLAMTGLWGVLTLALVLASRPGMPPGEALPHIYWAWVVVSVYFLALCTWRSARIPEKRQTP